MTKVMKCTCQHEDQDEIHGKGRRVFNSLPKEKDRPQEYRCTVCLRVV
jgi:hypothetical protein